MSKPVIEVQGLSKSYKISHKLKRNEHPTIKEDIVRLARKPLELMGAAGGVDKEEFWALKDINFEVETGDVVGIMGRNGSGKSTLFKILSRITQPTEGVAILHRKTTSLLEVGTGFHPELTGRENVYFNGSILGMKKVEIDKKFDEIIAFSEVEKFLDTPIKFYSSGMKVRLAFSIAAHLDPEILIIDEVLSVGDVKFKEKSLKRMKEVADSGKTILFVSHIVSQIEKICNRGILLDHGVLKFDGELDTAIDKYIELNELDVNDPNSALGEDSSKTGAKDVDSGNLSLLDIKTELKPTKHAPEFSVEVSLRNNDGADYDNLWIGIMLVDNNGKNVAFMNNDISKQHLELKHSEEIGKFKLTVPQLNLLPGTYSLNVAVKDKESIGDPYLRLENKAKFKVPNYSFGSYTLNKRNSSSLPPVLLEHNIEKQ